MAGLIVFEHNYVVFGDRRMCAVRQSSLEILVPASEFHLFIVVIALVIDHVEESQFVDPLTC